jgi:hypothetical protein
MARRRAMLCTIGKDDGKEKGNALLYWKRLWQGNRTMLCNIENLMAKATDNALQYWL